jgi:hypothetical protein
VLPCSYVLQHLRRILSKHPSSLAHLEGRPDLLMQLLLAQAATEGVSDAAAAVAAAGTAVAAAAAAAAASGMGLGPGPRPASSGGGPAYARESA